MVPYPEPKPQEYTVIEFDPDTQMSVFLDGAGAPLEMGAHGTAKPTKSMQDNTSNQDGKGDQDMAQDSEQD
jgi:putative ATP-grasp target RiPP